jgi:hypothetical protein
MIALALVRQSVDGQAVILMCAFGCFHSSVSSLGFRVFIPLSAVRPLTLTLNWYLKSWSPVQENFDKRDNH